MNTTQLGIYNKYTVIDNKTGQPVDGAVFVLKPDKDPAALKSLETYASATDNTKLSEDIMMWIDQIQGDTQTVSFEVKGDLVISPANIVPFERMKRSWEDALMKVQRDGTRVVNVEVIAEKHIKVTVEVPEVQAEAYNSGSYVSMSISGMTKDGSH